MHFLFQFYTIIVCIIAEKLIMKKKFLNFYSPLNGVSSLQMRYTICFIFIKIVSFEYDTLEQASRWPRCWRICMCRSHQSVAELLGRSSHCLDKTLTHQLQATGGRRWGDTTLCTGNWCKKVPSGVPD